MHMTNNAKLKHDFDFRTKCFTLTASNFANDISDLDQTAKHSDAHSQRTIPDIYLISFI